MRFRNENHFVYNRNAQLKLKANRPQSAPPRQYPVPGNEILDPVIASSSKTLASCALDSGRTSTPGAGCQVAGEFPSVGDFRADGTHSSRNEVAEPAIFFLLKNPIGDGGEGSGRTSVAEGFEALHIELSGDCKFPASSPTIPGAWDEYQYLKLHASHSGVEVNDDELFL
ncbi:hypothetical protein Cgig2_017763 [Carnegiea gigantea]|uniref:Uncharacterized protein n=1 Tax=Carnegiea gigantea TaxID=171969 RepID=A0A9Q1KXD2_9CARY|nr:hypothetical protein Cgig2_017763 [Carnegiea gigantea]